VAVSAGQILAIGPSRPNAIRALLSVATHQFTNP
jgi:hypothetical protein